MSDFVIEKNISFYGVNTCWAWLSAMEVGDSVLITQAHADRYHFKDKETTRNNMLRQLAKRGMKGKSRTTPCGNIRLWRVS